MFATFPPFCFRIVFTVFVVVFLFPGLALAACPVEIATPFSYLHLINQKYIEGLGAESHREAALCAEQKEGCTAKASAPVIDDIPVFDKPSGKIVARIEITYAREGITGVFIHKNKTQAYIPAIYDSDWFYGGWFSATLLDKKEEWKQIALPEITAGWVQSSDENVYMIKNDLDRVYALGGRPSFKVLSVEENGLVIRDEQEPDMWCQGSPPPPLKPFQEKHISVKETYDEKCNLLVSPIYLRGC